MAQGNASLEIIASACTPLLMGADPLAHRVVQDRLFHQHIKLGPEGAYAAALTAIDIALWDLKGKLLGQPLYQLLGGAWRTELPFYASIGHNGVRSVDEVCRVVEDWLKLEPVQIKIRFDADKTQRDADLAGCAGVDAMTRHHSLSKPIWCLYPLLGHWAVLIGSGCPNAVHRHRGGLHQSVLSCGPAHGEGKGRRP